MPKPELYGEDDFLERDLIQTLLAGHHEYRPDLAYPESHSDMAGAVRGLLRMYEVKRRPLPEPLKLKCHGCKGVGEFTLEAGPGYRKVDECPLCHYKGWVPG